MPLSKNILQSPPGDDVLHAVGGPGGAALKDVNLALTYAQRQFPDKSGYTGLDIVQPAVMVLDATRTRILLVFRESMETREGQPAVRKTAGDSVLLSSSQVADANDIVAEKVASGVGRGMPLNVEFVGMNVLPDGTRYVFDVRPVVADVDAPVGTDPDKRMEMVDLAAAVARVQGAMEQRLLELLREHLAVTGYA